MKPLIRFADLPASVPALRVRIDGRPVFILNQELSEAERDAWIAQLLEDLDQDPAKQFEFKKIQRRPEEGDRPDQTS